MKTMKLFAQRLSALALVVIVGLTALVPAALAASASLPQLPADQCVVDDANVLSSDTVQTITDLNNRLSASCEGAQIGVLTVDSPAASPPRTTPQRPSTLGASAAPARTTACSSCW